MPDPDISPNASAASTELDADQRIKELEDLTNNLLAELQRLQGANAQPQPTVPTAPIVTPQTVENSQLFSELLAALETQQRSAPHTKLMQAPPSPEIHKATMAPEQMPQEISHLSYLINEMGLDAKTAIMLLQISTPTMKGHGQPSGKIAQRSYHDSLAESILQDLENELASTYEGTQLSETILLPSENVKKIMSDAGISIEEQQPAEQILTPQLAPNTATPNPQMPISTLVENKEFQPLTDYFQSVLKVAQ